MLTRTTLLWFVAPPPPGTQPTSEQLQRPFILSRIGFSVPTFSDYYDMLVEFMEWLYAEGSGLPTHIGDTYSWHNPLFVLFVSRHSIDWSNDIPGIVLGGGLVKLMCIAF